jgi:hypothetical protein
MLNLGGPFTKLVKSEWMVQGLVDFDAVGVKFHLYQNNLTPSEDTLLADFVEADYDGYAAVAALAAAYPSYFIMPDGSALGVFDVTVLFIDGGSTTPNTIYGLYVTNTGGTQLLASLVFDTPKVLDAVDKFVRIEFALRMPAASPDCQADVTSNG